MSVTYKHARQKQSYQRDAKFKPERWKGGGGWLCTSSPKQTPMLMAASVNVNWKLDKHTMNTAWKQRMCSTHVQILGGEASWFNHTNGFKFYRFYHEICSIRLRPKNVEIIVHIFLSQKALQLTNNELKSLKRNKLQEPAILSYSIAFSRSQLVPSFPPLNRV